MKALTEAAEALQELAKLPETTQAAIQKQHGRLNTQDAQIQDLQNRIQGIPKSEDVEKNLRSIMIPAFAEFMKELKQSYGPPDYTFLIDPLSPDKSLEEAIKKGQEIQQPFWEEGEEKFTEEFGDSPSGPGWYGSTHMPVITLLFSGSE